MNERYQVMRVITEPVEGEAYDSYEEAQEASRRLSHEDHEHAYTVGPLVTS